MYTETTERVVNKNIPATKERVDRHTIYKTKDHLRNLETWFLGIPKFYSTVKLTPSAIFDRMSTVSQKNLRKLSVYND